MAYPWILHGKPPIVGGYAVTPDGEDDVSRLVNANMRNEGLDPDNNNHRMNFVDRANQQAIDNGNPRAHLATFDDKKLEVHPPKSGPMRLMQRMAGYNDMQHDPNKPGVPNHSANANKAG